MNQTTRQILNVLRNADEYVSSHGLCDALGISRAAVWKHVEQLRHQGYAIDSLPHHGYRLVSSPDIPSALEIQPFLTTESLGRVIEFRTETGSTNEDADTFAEGGAPEGMVVTADCQNQGRGRMTRSWHSPAGCNAYMSMVLRPAILPREAPQLAIVAACAVARALDTCDIGAQAELKWPNDILVDRRKLAGILCTMKAETDRIRHIILGIGINVNMSARDFPPDITEKATSLQILVGRKLSRSHVCATVLNHLEPAYSEWLVHGLAPFLSFWEERSVLRGKKVTVEALSGEIEGDVVGLEDDGALRLADINGESRRIYSGDVHITSW